MSQPHCRVRKASGRAGRASFALALVALAGGTVCIVAGQWSPGLILVFAAVAGIMTAWQVVTDAVRIVGVEAPAGGAGAGLTQRFSSRVRGDLGDA